MRSVLKVCQGPSDVLQSLLVFQPGATIGWQKHPGPVVVVLLQQAASLCPAFDPG